LGTDLALLWDRLTSVPRVLVLIPERGVALVVASSPADTTGIRWPDGSTTD